MANLPGVPRRFVFTPQVESQISGADVARPYQMVAQIAGAVGGALQNAEDANAKADGANAVIRDQDGNLQVTLRSNLTTGGREYNAMALQTYLARSSNDAQSALRQIGIDAKNDPAVFTASAKEFNRRMLQNAPAQVRGPLQTMLEGTSQELHDGIVVDKRNSDVKSALGAFTAKRDLLDDQLASIARGGGTDTEAYVEKRDEFRNLWQTLADNPDYDISQEEADIGIKRAESRYLAEAAVGSVQRVYATDGMAAAEKAADSLLTDQNLDLTPAERRQYRGLALSDIKAADAERRADLRLFRPEAQQVLTRLKAGEGLDDADVDETISQLGELGDPVLAGKLIRARASGRFVREFQYQSDAQQLSAAQEALAAPVDTTDAAALLRRFEGFREGAYYDVNAFRAGYGSDTVTRADGTIEAVTKDTVVTKDDAERDLTRRAQEFANTASNQVGSPAWDSLDGSTRAALTSVAYNYGSLPESVVGAIRTGDKEKIASAVESLSANPGRRAEEAAVIRGGTGSGIDAEALKAMRTEITADAKSHWTSIQNGFKAGTPPPADEIREFAAQVALVDDGDFRQQVADQLSTYADGYLLGNMPPAEADQVVADIRAGAGEDGYSQIERDALATYAEARDTAAAAIKSDAVGYGQSRQLIGVPPPLDFSSPEATAAGMAGREKAAAKARELFQAPSVPALRPAEAASVAATIATGPPDQAQNALTALANVSDDSLAATLGMAPIKDAIGGAVRGNDPQKFSSAMTALDTLWARAPETLANTFGGDVMDTLQDWQAKLRYMTPDELTNELKSRADPAVVERRKRLETAGRAIVREKQSLDSVVAAFDPGYLTTGPGAPTDPLTADMFMADYETMFASRYAATLDAGTAQSQAVARMRGKWTRSDLNGGRITYLAPESAYPPHDGSWQWMHDQISADLSTFGNEPSDFSVVADRTTEAEVQAGKPPSYLVTIKRAATGEFDLVRNADGKPMRYAWDTSKAQADEEAKFKAERDRIFGDTAQPGMVGRGGFPSR